MKLEQPCKNWQAEGSCKFASKCRFRHGDADAARHTERSAINCKIAAPNASQPLMTSASGSVINLPRSTGIEEWRQIITSRSVGGAEFHTELSRRFLLALLRPLLPHLADPLSRSLCTSLQLLQLLHTEQLGDLVYETVRKKIASWMCIEAAQATGHARLARMCHVEQLHAACASGAAVCDVYALRTCRACRFPNEDLQWKTCISCGRPLFQPTHPMQPYNTYMVDIYESSQSLAPEQVLRKMRKLEKKLNQIKLLKQQEKDHAAKLQKDQVSKVAEAERLQDTLRALRLCHPEVFFNFVDSCPKTSATDIAAVRDKSAAMRSRTCSFREGADMGAHFDYGWHNLQQRPNGLMAFYAKYEENTDIDASFYLPLSHNQRRTTQMLHDCHLFDLESAAATSSLAAHHPATLLSQHALLEPVASIMQQAVPEMARLATLMLVRHLDPDCLHRIVQSPLTPAVKCSLALSQLQRQRPQQAEMLNFMMCNIGCGRPRVNSYDFGDICATLSDADVQCMAVAGELVQLPAWLQGLQCTSRVNEAANMHVTLTAPTKVYKLCLSAKSHPRQLLTLAPWASEHRAPDWNFETSAKLFARYDGLKCERDKSRVSNLELHEPPVAIASELTFHKAQPQDCLVCSMTLDAGVYTLDSGDAVYFFDTHRHVNQRRLRASAPLCKFMQQDGSCSAGDCCKFSHATPRYFTPEVPVYIAHMLLQCRRAIGASLHQRAAGSIPRQLRARLYSKCQEQRFFAAHRRVLHAGLIALLVLRLISPNVTKCRQRERAAYQQLPLKIYSGLMHKATDFDDGDPRSYIDECGYRFKTLFNHRHSRQQHVLASGALFFVGGAMNGEIGAREIPPGWEICPADDVSIAVCSRYAWQSAALVLGDGNNHATLGCLCQQCKMCALSQTARKPHTLGSSLLTIRGRSVQARGFDVLIRRRLCSAAAPPAAAAAAPAQSKKSLTPEKQAVRDLADLLARCCLERADAQQRAQIHEYMDKNRD